MDDEAQNGLDPELIEAAEKQIDEQTQRIEFYITEYSIELLAVKMRNGDFVVPEYQREFTWEDTRKWKFIESVLMGLPIPFLFFWENPETGTLEIVDGSQRLRTIEDFIYGNLELGELEVLSLLDGFRFTDLPESRQRKIKNRSIRGIILSEHADENSRFEVFERINTGSKNANAAEVRRGALRGPFLELVKALANEEIFKSLAPVPEAKEDLREREELVTRFFAYSGSLDDYKDRVREFLSGYTKRMNTYLEQHPSEVDKLRQDFLDTMEFVDRNFPLGFRKTVSATTTPRARFEAIAIGSYLALQQRPELFNQSLRVRDWLDNDEFKKVTTSDGANAINRLKGRIYFVRDRLLEA